MNAQVLLTKFSSYDIIIIIIIINNNSPYM